jgi:hypothetical protein
MSPIRSCEQHKVETLDKVMCVRLLSSNGACSVFPETVHDYI